MPPEVQIDPGRRQPGEWQQFSWLWQSLAADRVKTLRVGYHSWLKDPALLEELKKRRWVVDSISGGSWRS